MKYLGFLRVFLFAFALLATTGAYAAYTCPGIPTYTSCSSGYYLSDCGSRTDGGTATPTAGNSCDTCPVGSTCSGGTTCPLLNSCDPGEYLVNGVCTECLPGKWCPGGSGAASNDCPSSYPNSDAGTSSEGRCYRTSYNYGSQTNPSTPTGCASATYGTCSPGSCSYRDYYTGTDESCSASDCTRPINTVTAQPGRYVSGKTCPSCPPGTVSAGGSVTSCGGCTGKQVSNASQTSCVDCTGIQVPNSSHTQCGDCVPPYVNATNTACLTCPPGTYYDPVKKECSGGCDEGYWCNGGVKTQCPIFYPNSAANSDAQTDCWHDTSAGNRIDAPMATVETDCPSNSVIAAHPVYYGSVSAQCTGCGTQIPNAAGDACMDAVCSAGTFGLPGSCDQCPDGETSLPGALTAAECFIPCPAWTGDMGNCISIDPTPAKSFWTGSEYPTCGFTYNAPIGYNPILDQNNVACPIHKYGISYEPYDGTDGMDVKDFTIADVPAPKTLGTPAKDGYSFTGWYDNSLFAGSIITTAPPTGFDFEGPKAEKTLYAKWACAPDYYKSGNDTRNVLNPVCQICPVGETTTNGTSAGGDGAIGTCRHSEMDCTDNEGNTGQTTCDYDPIAGTYTANCDACDISICKDGKYPVTNPSTGKIECADCPQGKYCEDNTVKDCPAPGATLFGGSDSVEDCIMTCPEWTVGNPMPAGCANVTIATPTVRAINETEYEQCRYNPVGAPGYDSAPPEGNTPTPACTIHTYRISYKPYGGIGGMDVTEFDITNEPAPKLLGTPVRDNGASTFLGWYENPLFSGAVITTAPPTGFDFGGPKAEKTLHAKWECSKNAHLEGDRCSACPAGGYTEQSGDNAKTECKKLMTCSDDINGTTVYGEKLCTFNVSDNDYTNCEAVCHLGSCPPGTYGDTCEDCDGGYYCPGGEEDKKPCTAGTFCPPGTITPNLCPFVGATGERGQSDALSDSGTDCRYDCPSRTIVNANPESTPPVIPTVNFDGTEYPACEYDPDCATGYFQTGGAAFPICSIQGYNIEYELYGRQNTTDAPVSYTLETLPVTLPQPGNAAIDRSVFLGWYETGDRSQMLEGQKITEIPAGTTGNKKFYAKWGCAPGHYMNPTTSACIPVGNDYYSPQEDINRYECPDGFITKTQEATAMTSCLKIELAAALDPGHCDGGTRGAAPNDVDAYNKQPTNCGTDNTCVYTTQPTFTNMVYQLDSEFPITGADGYYFPGTESLSAAELQTLLASGDLCRPVTNGWYSPAQSGSRDECPAVYSGSEAPQAVITNCYWDCPAKTVANASSVNPIDPRVNWNGTRYPMCEYKIVCESDYCLDGESCVPIPDGSICTDDGTGPKQCPPGTYPTTDQVTGKMICDECPPGKICDGTGIRDCLDVGDGTYAKSDIGNKSDDMCYKDCESPDGGVTTVTGRDYYNAPDTCAVTGCLDGFHPNGMRCESDTMDCSVPNATESYRHWDYDKLAYGLCTVKTCDAGYHIASNVCVLNERDCTIENGRGVQAWDEIRNRWGECEQTDCKPGYTLDKSETHELTRQCGQCKNKFSALGEVAASSYVNGCEIAACMYQGEKYNLENNECVPICDDGYEDETGMMHWNEGTKKCERICKSGFMSW